jgi:DNA-binding transcriptional ArsR family regulator
MDDFINITKALSDSNRVRVLLMLSGGELCVCQIIEMLGLAPSTVSKHMYILKQAKLVNSRKEGRWMYYRLAGGEACKEVKEALKWTLGSLSEDKHVQTDRKALKKVCKMERSELCKKYKS